MRPVPVIFAAPASPSSIHPPTGPETNDQVGNFWILSQQFAGFNEKGQNRSLSRALGSSAIVVRGRAAGAVALIAAAAGPPAPTVAVVVVVPR